MAIKKRRTLMTNPLDEIEAHPNINRVVKPVKTPPKKSVKVAGTSNQRVERIIDEKKSLKKAVINSKISKTTKLQESRTNNKKFAKKSGPSKQSQTITALQEASKSIATESVAGNSKRVIKKKTAVESNAAQQPSTALQLFEREAGAKSSVAIANPTLVIRIKRAKKVVWVCSTISGGAGIVPGVILGTTLNAGIQLKMIQEICKCFDVPFKDETASAILTSILGSGIASAASSSIGGILINHIKDYGSAIASVAGPVFNFASTYALGQIFIEHFVSHGSLIDFDPKKMKRTFDFEYLKAKNIFKRNHSPAI